MTDKKPSEVFLKAIQALAIADPDMPGTEFKEYAEAWRQICHLEELIGQIRWENLLADLTPGEDKKGPGDPSPSAQDDSPKAITYDCASAPMPDADEAKKARSDSARTAAINRKRNLLEKLDGLRASGTTLAAIAGRIMGLLSATSWTRWPGSRWR